MKNPVGYKAVNTHLKFNEIHSRLTTIHHAYLTEIVIETMEFRNSSQNVHILISKSVSFALPLFREHDSCYIFHESLRLGSQ